MRLLEDDSMIVIYSNHFAIFPVKLKDGGVACFKTVCCCRQFQIKPRGGYPIYICSWFARRDTILIDKLRSPDAFLSKTELVENYSKYPNNLWT